MKDVYMIGTPENVLSAIPDSPANAPALTDTRNYIAAMTAAGMGSATQIDEGGIGWITGRELAAAIESAKSIAPNDVKNALAHQTIVTGGIQCYFWKRTPSNYANITNVQQAVVTVAADGTFTVLPHVGS